MPQCPSRPNHTSHLPAGRVTNFVQNLISGFTNCPEVKKNLVDVHYFDTNAHIEKSADFSHMVIFKRLQMIRDDLKSSGLNKTEFKQLAEADSFFYTR